MRWSPATPPCPSTSTTVTSLSGKIGLPGQTNYSAAKAGIVGMTKAAAKELGHLGVRVNAVRLGLIRTAMTEAMRQDIWDAKEREVPLQRAANRSRWPTRCYSWPPTWPATSPGRSSR